MYIRRFWLLFAQTVTVGLALWFIVATLKPEWMAGAFNTMRKPVATSSVAMQEAALAQPAPGSYRTAAKLAMPSVVNIYTTSEAKSPSNPFMEDPFFKKFFGDQNGGDESDDKSASLGSGS